jgi:hypothetical protein
VSLNRKQVVIVVTEHLRAKICPIAYRASSWPPQ